jgi:hypothetical protein
MRPNLSFEKLAATLAALGTTAIVAGCASGGVKASEVPATPSTSSAAGQHTCKAGACGGPDPATTAPASSAAPVLSSTAVAPPTPSSTAVTVAPAGTEAKVAPAAPATTAAATTPPAATTTVAKPAARPPVVRKPPAPKASGEAACGKGTCDVKKVF